jgi:hypothetical protein
MDTSRHRIHTAGIAKQVTSRERLIETGEMTPKGAYRICYF